MTFADANSFQFPLFLGLFIVFVSGLIYLAFFRKKLVSTSVPPEKNGTLQHESAVSLVEMKDQNLNYIRYELHENVAQKLSVARLLTNKIKFTGDTDKNNIVEINMLIGECIQDIRNLSASFIKRKPDEMGFLELIESEIYRIQKVKHCNIAYTANYRNLEINKTRKIILFRLIQTSLIEILNFSKSKQINLIITDHDKHIEIEISDLGIDFYKFVEIDRPAVLRMRKRAEMIDTDLVISSVGNIGTKISIIYNK